MTQLIPDRWLSAESEGFEKLFGITSQCFEAFERLTALNLQAIRFGLAENQEALARTSAAHNLPEFLSLPVLLAPVGAAQALSYSRQFFEIMSNLQCGVAPRQPANAVPRRQLADSLVGNLTGSLVPCDVPGGPATSPASAAGHAAVGVSERVENPADKTAILPMHTE
ncbi:TIGR01841 family phasin [Paraburkholderia sp. Cpub6]|uniref:TIGR01841 family phasin n=1 Tax=Paraburkholderia sp. Cpub6 TaxID=2723094 RepID=UPI0016126EFE|nr:TIGR01841 family phasin [Paraburkholderia sp. Cpub6]MBB5462407.1 phasin family protein [Paraburkholderia sp. Cpub6]